MEEKPKLNMFPKTVILTSTDKLINLYNTY